MNPSVQPCMLGHRSQTLNCRGLSWGLSYTLSPPPHLHILYCLFWDKGTLKFPNWFWTHSVTQSDLDIVILLLQLPEYQGFIPTIPERVNKIYIYIFQHTIIILKDDSLQQTHRAGQSSWWLLIHSNFFFISNNKQNFKDQLFFYKDIHPTD